MSFKVDKTYDFPKMYKILFSYMNDDNRSLVADDAVDSFNTIIYAACAKSMKKIYINKRQKVI